MAPMHRRYWRKCCARKFISRRQIGGDLAPRRNPHGDMGFCCAPPKRAANWRRFGGAATPNPIGLSDARRQNGPVSWRSRQKCYQTLNQAKKAASAESGSGEFLGIAKK